ncbi:hypothetical protein [Mesorhizobium sp. Cs1299R1N3]|uniref:hypothetical protein n=1 Tax=Mesorhizobium sp. Cs1299R1N3 TaxID=3015173 RepID=UPI00301CEE10
MKSTEAYRVLRTHLAPIFQGAGFKRAKGLLSWMRPQGQRHLVVWCQVSQFGWDDFAGSQFTVEFQLSDEAVVGAFPSRRRRFPKMLDYNGRDEVRTIQNRVISSLHRPPANHPLLHTNEAICAIYLKGFQRIDQPYTEGDDIWLRYGCEDHLITWARFIANHLPDWLKQAEAWDGNEADGSPRRDSSV